MPGRSSHQSEAGPLWLRLEEGCSVSIWWSGPKKALQRYLNVHACTTSPRISNSPRRSLCFQSSQTGQDPSDPFKAHMQGSLAQLSLLRLQSVQYSSVPFCLNTDWEQSCPHLLCESAVDRQENHGAVRALVTSYSRFKQHAWALSYCSSVGLFRTTAGLLHPHHGFRGF